MKRFLSFVEIHTKLATVFPMLLALSYVFYTTGSINIFSTMIYIPAALLIDMSVTAINNHFNAREEGVLPHYGYAAGICIIMAMLLTASAIGLYLVYLHGIILLLAGVLSIAVGITYTLGPMPISKTLFGEVFAGLFAAGMVMFIVVLINDADFEPLAISYVEEVVGLAIYIDIITLLSFGMAALPAILCVSNILLANNICDIDKDRQHRYTLPHHLGRTRALWVFAGLYCAVYAVIIAAVILGVLPHISLLTLLTAVFVYRNVRMFFTSQVKSETFGLSVSNFMIICGTLSLCLLIGGFLA